jgi:hypothetical protein
MRRLQLWSLSALFVVACAAPASVAEHPGTSGAALASALTVHVQAEQDGRPIANATVEVQGVTTQTDANGDAHVPTSGAAVDLRVVASGFVTERWMGVDRERAIVGLATPLVSRTLTGSIQAGTADVAVSAATTLSMLRTSTPLGSTSACVGGVCDVTLTVETRTPALDVVLVDASAARVVENVAVDSGNHFLIAPSMLGQSGSLVTFTVTIPAAPGLDAVVGVPGVAREGGVALFPGLTAMPVSVMAPALEGSIADARHWYIAHASNSDGSGTSMIFDRSVGADGVVTLPSAFLDIPRATASGVVGIDVQPGVDLYVVEAFAGDAAERALVFTEVDAHIDVPISLTGASRVVVRAIDTEIDRHAIDLVAAEQNATRIATIEL